MKELSIEEKAKRYDEIIERLKDFQFEYRFSPFSDVISDKFPELAESDNERMIKSMARLVKAFHDCNFPTPEGFERKDMIAWLEKQGEKPYVELKFKVGDLIKLSKEPKYPAREIISIKNDGYYFDSAVYLPFERQNDWELVEQKPAWSEEDEELLSFCCAAIELSNYSSDEHRNYAISFLESIKDRVQQPKQELDEEDEKLLELSVENLTELKDRFGEGYGKVGDCINWLKSLKDRYTWKPNEEHIYWLKWAINRMPDTEKANEAEAVLEELLEQLKKLRNE